MEVGTGTWSSIKVGDMISWGGKIIFVRGLHDYTNVCMQGCVVDPLG